MQSIPRITQKGEPFYLFKASGSHYEIGKAKGEQMSADLEAVWNMFSSRMCSDFGTPPEKEKQTYEWLRTNLERHVPWMAEQLEGMSDGSGMGLDRLYFTCHYGVLWSAGGVLCTSVAVKSDTEGPLLGQNLDIGGDDLYFVEELHPSNGYATLSDGMAGMTWSPTGMNECGLVVGSSNICSPVRCGMRPVVGGVPYIFFPRMVLTQCADVPEAVELLKSHSPAIPPGGGYQLNLIDAKGNMAVVDKLEDRTVVRQCSESLNYTTNYSLDNDLEAFRTGDQATDPSFIARAEKIESAFSAAGGVVGESWLERLLTDHSGDGRICKHGVSDNGYSRLSFIYIPNKLKMRISNGVPCLNVRQDFAL